MPTIADLPVVPLHEVLAGLPMPDGYGPVAESWRCRLAPEVTTEQEMLHFFHHGVPVFPPQAASQPVHDVCPDAFEFIGDERWGRFPTPKIAFEKGWAGPGTEFESEELHHMVDSFQEVLDGGAAAAGDAEKKRVLNLQFFHRPDAATHPQIPKLAELLQWPSFAAAGAVCDNATRVSKRGAMTWWHLDDAGEFVMQTGLSIKPHAPGEHPVKLFIYGPNASYDWFMHDAETDDQEKIVGLNIFETPAERLPPAEHLPVLTVAVLRAGGRPLVSPPNIPHCVLTIHDCVMVEQRRIMDLFLEQCAYLLFKAQRWQGHPIVYKYLNDDLRCADTVQAVTARLLRLLRPRDPDADLDSVETAMRAGGAAGSELWTQRLLTAVLTLASCKDFFPMADGAVVPPPEPVTDPEAPLQAAAQPDPAAVALDAERREAVVAEAFLAGATEELVAALEQYWDVTAAWSQNGKAFALDAHLRCDPALPPRTADPEYAGVCYVKSQPVWGPVRPKADAAKSDTVAMRKAADQGTLDDFLRRAKPQRDDVLDDLF